MFDKRKGWWTKSLEHGKRPNFRKHRCFKGAHLTLFNARPDPVYGSKLPISQPASQP